DQAIGAAILITLAAKPGDALAHADLTADHPVDRAAGEHRLDAARMVAGIDPAGAALLEARGAKPAQFVDVADPDRHLQHVQRALVAVQTVRDPVAAIAHQPGFSSASSINSAPSSTGSPAA